MLILLNCHLFVCVLIRDIFRKKIINAFSNLKMSLHLETKIKSNGYLDIRTEREN